MSARNAHAAKAARRAGRDARAWVQGELRRVLAGAEAGTVPCCPHFRLDGSRPAFVVPSWPSVSCARCFPFGQPAVTDPVEDATCDRCRRPGRQITPTSVRLGRYTVLVGVCEDRCRAALERPASAQGAPPKGSGFRQ